MMINPVCCYDWIFMFIFYNSLLNITEKCYNITKHMFGTVRGYSYTYMYLYM